jgi:hypothetical protein
MEQRPLRLGDILDDYCPRERRVTNHAIVAIIENTVRQTRCTTCDAEHAYKGGQAPRRRAKKGTPEALYQEVLAGLPEADVPPALAAPVVEPPADVPASPTPEVAVAAAPVEEHHAAPAADPEPAGAAIEDGPVHRPLIRATLPRVEGQKETRPIPDFTMRQPLGRGRFRGGDGRMRSRGGEGGNGHRSPGGSRFGGPRTGGRRRGR